MAHARVELKEGLSLESRGRTFKKGQSILLTNPDDIQYYMNHSQFTVTILDETPKTPAKEQPKVLFKVEEENTKDENTKNEASETKTKPTMSQPPISKMLKSPVKASTKTPMKKALLPKRKG